MAKSDTMVFQNIATIIMSDIVFNCSKWFCEK